MTYYERRLPHWHPDGRSVFITFRLHGSLPQGRMFSSGPLSSGRAFVAVDRLLDASGNGPLYLAQPTVARVVCDAIMAGADERRYDLHAFVIMPNHVHLLLTPLVPVPTLLRHLKGASARLANQILGRTGQPFWQQESYDRWVRVEKEFRKIQAYIEDNPVKAGLAKAASTYRWSSAWDEKPDSSPAAG